MANNTTPVAPTSTSPATKMWRGLVPLVTRRNTLIAGAVAILLTGAGIAWAVSSRLAEPSPHGTADFLTPIPDSTDFETVPDQPTAPSVEMAPPALPGEVTIDESLPDALPLPLPDDVWSQTGPGWVLATYRPALTRAEKHGYNWTYVDELLTRQVIYLVDPTGQRFQVMEVDPTSKVTLQSWTAGETTAYIGYCPTIATCSGASTLDLTTGEITPVSFSEPVLQVYATLPDSRRVWIMGDDWQEFHLGLEHDGQFVQPTDGWRWHREVVSPDGRWAAVGKLVDEDLHIEGVMSLETGAVSAVPQLPELASCVGNDWSAESLLVVACSQRNEEPSDDTFFTFDPSTGVVTPMAPPSSSMLGRFPAVDQAAWVSPGVWAGGYWPGEYYASTDLLGIDDHGTPRAVEVLLNGEAVDFVAGVHAAGGLVYFQADFYSDTTVVFSYNPATGEQILLLPTPPGGPTVTAEAEPNVSRAGMTSWVVAP